MNYEIKLIETDEQNTVVIRKTTSVQKLPQEIGTVYSSIVSHLSELGIKPKETPFTAYFNMDMENLEVEIGFPIIEKINGIGDIVPSTIPAGKKVTCIHKGSYNKLTEAYAAITEWINENKYVPTGVVYEYYSNSPTEVSEDELLTKIVFLLNE